jgi:nitrogen regulatory protein PII
MDQPQCAKQSTGDPTTLNVQRPLVRLTNKGGIAMKIIEAIMQPFKLDDVTEALMGIGVEGMTVSEVKGFGHQKGGQERYNGNAFTSIFVPKVKIEVVVEDSLVHNVIDTITRYAKTDSAGDGRIFVMDLVAAMRIKTGPMCEPVLAR